MQKEADLKVYDWLVEFVLSAPPNLRTYRHKVRLQIPTLIQEMVVRAISINPREPFVSMSTFYDYPVIPGYEMAAVLFHVDAVLDPENGIYKKYL